MLIVMSDIHFAESKTNQIGNISYNLNLPAIVYLNYFKEITSLIKQNQVKKIELVLAGDIFEITRSGLWMKDEIRPYVHNREIEPGSRLEERILDILDEIGKDTRVSQTLEIFRSLEEIFNIPVELQYIPGNHDRLTNSTPAVITKVRSLLGLPESNQRFDNEYIFYSQNEPLVLVRHGHEYDPVNFALDLKKLIKLPPRIERDNYDRPVVGDFITVEIASRLPIFFKNHYSDERILGDEQLRRLYQRLIEFDNVRPATALLNYLIVTPGIQMRETWKLLEPVFRKILLDIEKKSFFDDIHEYAQEAPAQNILDFNCA